MKVTKDNIKSIQYYFALEKRPVLSCGLLLETLVDDLDKINDVLNNRLGYGSVFIDYCDEHTEYSPERTDPCPDFYGTFSLRLDEKPYEVIGLSSRTLSELDGDICLLSDLVEKMCENNNYKNSMKNDELAIEFVKEYKKCRGKGVPEEISVLSVLHDLANRKDKEIQERSVDLLYLTSWYISSINETVQPCWTEEHLDELLKDFYIIPKKEQK